MDTADKFKLSETWNISIEISNRVSANLINLNVFVPLEFLNGLGCLARVESIDNFALIPLLFDLKRGDI